MLTRSALDRLAIGPCSDPSCDHYCHGKTFLHSRCHVKAPYMLFKTQLKEIGAMCVHPGCEKIVVVLPMTDFRLLNSKWKKGILEPDCHQDESAVWLSYLFGSGVVKVECYCCRKVVADIVVK
jgi:hypothetical protein